MRRRPAGAVSGFGNVTAVERACRARRGARGGRALSAPGFLVQRLWFGASARSRNTGKNLPTLRIFLVILDDVVGPCRAVRRHGGAAVFARTSVAGRRGRKQRRTHARAVRTQRHSRSRSRAGGERRTGGYRRRHPDCRRILLERIGALASRSRRRCGSAGMQQRLRPRARHRRFHTGACDRARVRRHADARVPARDDCVNATARSIRRSSSRT